MKISPANATMGAFMTLLGGTNVQASAPEAREMLERGVADAITFPWGSIILFGIDKVVKYHMDMPFWTGAFVWGMNKDKYKAHVARATQRHRQSLHHRMGRENRLSLGRLRTRRSRETEIDAGS